MTTIKQIKNANKHNCLPFPAMISLHVLSILKENYLFLNRDKIKYRYSVGSEYLTRSVIEWYMYNRKMVPYLNCTFSYGEFGDMYECRNKS